MIAEAPINKVALSLQNMQAFLHDYYNSLVDPEPVGTVLLVAVGGQVQYVSNVGREQAAGMLQDLLARWKLGFPEAMPGESTPGDLQQFVYLLNALEIAGQAPVPAQAGYAGARAALLEYVGDLVGKANRAKAQP